MRSLIFNLFFYSYTFYIAARVYSLARLGRPPERMHHVLRLWGNSVLRAIDVILDSRIEIRGLERIPADRPVLFVSKHQSELDIILLGKLWPNINAVAMKELEGYPFFGTILRALDVILVSVEHGPQNRTEQTVAGAAKTFESGRPMIIYPEGTLMSLGDKERYRRGAAHIYTRLNPVVIPVATSVGVVWPRREWRKHSGTAGAMEYLHPIEPGLEFDTFMQTVEETIETNTMRLIREFATGDVLESAEARHLAAQAAPTKDAA